MMTIEIGIGSLLERPQSFLDRMETAVREGITEGGEYLLSKIVGAGGTFYDAPESIDGKVVFRGALKDDILRNGVMVDGDMRSGISARLGSSLPYAKVVEEGGKWRKHPPIVETKRFSVPAKKYQRRSSKGNPYTATRRAHEATVKVSVLDAWIKHSRRMAVGGESLEAYRERAGIAYRMGERYKTTGYKGRHVLSRAVEKYGKRAADIMRTRIYEELARMQAPGAAA